MLGDKIDALFVLREKRLSAQKDVDAMMAAEKVLRGEIIADLNVEGISGAAGSLSNVRITQKTVARVTDWEAVQKHIFETSAWDLLQRRVNDAAFRVRHEDGLTVPGIIAYIVTDLSLNRS